MILAGYWQASSTHPSPIRNNNAPRYLALAQRIKNLLRPGSHIGLSSHRRRDRLLCG